MLLQSASAQKREGGAVEAMFNSDSELDPREATAAAVTDLVVMVTPSEGVPGQWVAHVLNLDLVTQGDSIEHAFEMAREAVLEVIGDDLRNGREPLERPMAEDECWQLLARAYQRARPLTDIKDRSKIRMAVAQLRVTIPAAALPEHARPPEPEAELAPPAWQIAALREMTNHSVPSC